MTHKGLFRYPCHEPHELWGRVTFGPVGYLVAVQNDTWKVVYAPGLRFDYTDMQSVTVTRVGIFGRRIRIVNQTIQNTLLKWR